MKLMQGKNVLVTGSSRGIGFETALGLAKLGAHVIIVSHDQEHCAEAVAKIRSAAGEDAARYYTADLASQEAIRVLAAEIKTGYTHLDVLVNNVGGWFRKYQESPDGIELTFALNHLSYFLLTGLLLDLLKASAPARIVNVSSDAHRQADRIHFENIGFKGEYTTMKAYAQSKLANILFTHELARRLEGTGVTVNALHPGFVNSHLYRNFGLLEPLVRLFAGIGGKSIEEGAKTSIYVASSPALNLVSGKYFADEELVRSSEASFDQYTAERLWELSEELTGLTY
ncbi:MAG: SDR family oxidoreductase [Chloroflexota bacterium]|nr:SDR family oxidoreductase [Chloroflexota bacterium]